MRRFNKSVLHPSWCSDCVWNKKLPQPAHSSTFCFPLCFEWKGHTDYNNVLQCKSLCAMLQFYLEVFVPAVFPLAAVFCWLESPWLQSTVQGELYNVWLVHNEWSLFFEPCSSSLPGSNWCTWNTQTKSNVCCPDIILSHQTLVCAL